MIVCHIFLSLHILREHAWPLIMTYWHQPIEDMLKLLESRFHVTGGDNDFYYEDEFDQRRYIGKQFCFIFVMDGEQNSYIFVNGPGDECRNFSVDKVHMFENYLDYVKTMVPDDLQKLVNTSDQ